MKKRLLINYLLPACLLASLSACGLFGSNSKAEAPTNSYLALKESRGSVTGGEGLLSIGGSKPSPIVGVGVNSFLWRASLDTLSFMPLASADPFGGVIITDWYEDPKTRGERYKVNVLIMDKTLRADGIKVTVFKQQFAPKGGWRDVEVGKSLGRDLEDTILTRAREMRIAQAK